MEGRVKGKGSLGGEVSTLSFGRVGGSSAYTDHQGRTQGGINSRRRDALEALHELDLVRVIEREDWSVHIPILLARLCAEEVIRARLVSALGQAVKLGHLDGDRRNHCNIKVLSVHWRTPVNPQVWRVSPGIRLILERDWHRRLDVGSREGSLCLPGIDGDM